jgi:hypothetical protein
VVIDAEILARLFQLNQQRATANMPLIEPVA